MKPLKIVKANWLRHRILDIEAPISMLLNSKGKMCCMGFDCINNGANPADILGKLLPRHYSSLSFADKAEAAHINDRSKDIYKNISDQERLIKEVFTRNGVEVEFV